MNMISLEVIRLPDKSSKRSRYNEGQVRSAVSGIPRALTVDGLVPLHIPTYIFFKNLCNSVRASQMRSGRQLPVTLGFVQNDSLSRLETSSEGCSLLAAIYIERIQSY